MKRRFKANPRNRLGFVLSVQFVIIIGLIGLPFSASDQSIHHLGSPSPARNEFSNVLRSSSPAVPPTVVVGYPSSSFNLLDGAKLPSGETGYDLACMSTLTYDSPSGDLLVTADAGVGWFNLSSGLADRVTLLTGPGNSAPGAGPVGPPLDLADDVQDGWVYVTHANSTAVPPCYFPVAGGDYLTVINASTGAVNRTIPVGSSLAGITFDPTNDRVYVVDSSGGALYVLNGRTGAILDRISVGVDPQNIAVDNATGTLYVTNSGSSNLSVINASTDHVTGSIPLPNVSAPFDVVYDAADVRLFVDGVNNAVVASVDPSTGVVQYTALVASQPTYITLDPLNDHLYVSSYSTSSVSIIDASSANGSVMYTKVNDGTKGVAFDPGTAGVYFAGLDSPGNSAASRIHVFNGSSDTYVGAIPVSAAASVLAVVPGVPRVFAGDNFWSTLWAYNTTAHTSVPIAGVNAGSMAYDSTDRTLIVGAFGDGLYSNTGFVQLVNLSNDTIEGSFTTSGIGSSLVAWDSTNDSFWVWDWCGGTYCSSEISNYNATSGAFLRSVPLGAEYGTSMIFDPAHSELYISGSVSSISGATGVVYAIDAVNGTILWTGTFAFSQAMAYDPLDGTLYVVALGSSGYNITLLNATTGAYVTTASEPGNPYGQPIAYDAADHLVIGADIANTTELLAYNASTNSYLGAVPVPQAGVDGLAPDLGGGILYSTGGPALGTARFDGALHISSFVFNPSEVEVNGTLALRVNASGGGGGLTYSYSGLPAGCTSQNSSAWSCHPSRSGQYSVNLTVTDTLGAKAYSTSIVRVFPTLTIGPLNASRSLLPANSTLTLSAVVSGGVGGYAYRWDNAPPGCSNTSSTPLVCRPSGPGQFNISITVEDAVGDTVSSGPVTVHVVAPLGVTVSASRTHVDVGQNTTLTATLRGGVGAYSVNWTGLPPGCPPQNSTTLLCSPTQPGSYSVQANVTEPTLGTVDSNAVPLEVGGPLGASLSASRAALDIGQNVNLTVMIIGGLGPYSVDWTGLPPGCASMNSTTLDCSPSLPGTYSVLANVTDSTLGTISSNVISIGVNSALVASAVAASRDSLDVGQSTAFWANASGGSGTFTYNWTSLPPGCPAMNRSMLSCTVSTIGTSSVGATVRDSLGSIVGMRPVSVQVFVDPTLVSFTVSSTHGAVGTTVNLSVTVSGGSGAYLYSWTVPSICSTADAPRIPCRLTQVGSYTARVNVTDTNGVTLPSSLIEFNATPATIVPPPTHHPLSGAFNLEDEIALGAIAAVVAAIATALVLRRRRGGGAAGERALTIPTTPVGVGSGDGEPNR